MSDTNKDKYYAFAIAIMLTTESGLRADFGALNPDQRTPANLKSLIRNSLYHSTSGVADGKMAVKEPATLNQDLEDVVNQINVHTLVDNWETLNRASSVVDRSIRPLLDYDGRSYPSFVEQDDLADSKRRAISKLTSPAFQSEQAELFNRLQ